MIKQTKTAWDWGIWGIAIVGILVIPSGIVGSADATTCPSDRQSQMQANQNSQKIMGTVKKTKKVVTHGSDRESLIVQLKTQEEEKNIVLDLGDEEKLQGLDILAGKRVTVWGRSVNIDDQYVFVAHRLQTTKGTINIECRRMSSQQASDYQF